jgi:hypothetical protein
MAKFDLKSVVDAVDTFLPADRTASGTGSAVDLRGYESAAAYVSVGAKAGGTITPSLEDSVDGTTYAAVVAASLDGTFAAITTGTSTQRVGYIGDNRYVRGVFTQAGGTMHANFVILRGHPARTPLS